MSAFHIVMPFINAAAAAWCMREPNKQPFLGGFNAACAVISAGLWWLP